MNGFEGTIKRTHPKTFSGDRRHSYVGMEGRVGLADLLRFVEENAPTLTYDEIGLNWMTVVWEDDATPEEVAEQTERTAEQKRRLEAWERRTLADLIAKYGPPAPALNGEKP